MLDLFGNEIVEKRSLDRDVLTNVFIQSIYGIKEEELVSMLYSKYEAIIDFLRLCNENKTEKKYLCYLIHIDMLQQQKKAFLL